MKKFIRQTVMIIVLILLIVGIQALAARANDGSSTYVSVGPCLLHAYLPHTSGVFQYAHGRLDSCNTGCEGFPTTYCDDVDQVNQMEVCEQKWTGTQWVNLLNNGVDDCAVSGSQGQTYALDFQSPAHLGKVGEINRTWDWVSLSDDGGTWASTYQSSAWTCC